MNLRQLKYFIAVAEERNIGRAAERLNISQPPLTRQIHQIEEALGGQLFIRTPRGVELTMAGKLLLEEARYIVGRMDQARERVRRASLGQYGRLDVAIFGSAILGLIPRIIREFKQTYPDIDVVLHALGKLQQLEALRNDVIDVAFNRLLDPEPGLICEEISRERLLLAVQEGNPLVEKGIASISDLKGQPIVAFPSGSRGFIEKVQQLCRDRGFSPRIAQSVGDAVTGMALVASGFGICLVPDSVRTLTLPGVVYLPLTDPVVEASVDLSCIYRKDDNSPVLPNFLDVAHRVAAQNQ